MSFSSWIDQQISEAAERGAFDDLPGAGKPLPRRGGFDDGQAWIREYARREGVPAEEMLPTPLKLRKEIERLTEAAPGMRSEREVREVAADLNQEDPGVAPDSARAAGLRAAGGRGSDDQQLAGRAPCPARYRFPG